MAREILTVPEDILSEVIAVIRAGLFLEGTVSPRTEEMLRSWCDREEEYMKRCAEED